MILEIQLMLPKRRATRFRLKKPISPQLTAPMMEIVSAVYLKHLLPISHHTRQSAIGLPFISRKNFDGKEMAVTEYTMSEIVASIYEKIQESGLREGILFIDEINCVSETLAPAMLQFLQCKTFGSHKIPEGWLIVAAGNPHPFSTRSQIAFSTSALSTRVVLKKLEERK